MLKLYLQRTGYTAGPLFRASINGSGGPLSYDAAQHRWTRVVEHRRGHGALYDALAAGRIRCAAVADRGGVNVDSTGR
ncbi:hypothetical protein [Salinispora mooreana]|uniref:hypothetical protein n=1 Tax=Salinispora mooreana TaxID=999545 RepID=UPI000373A9E4|nr:hypothetical protein [Salinispora mooreana]